MKVSQILQRAARYVGKDDLAEYFAGNAPENTAVAKADAEFFLIALQFVSFQIADEYLAPLEKEERETEGFLPYSAFSHSVFRMLSVEKDGKNLSFEKRADGILTQKGIFSFSYLRRPERRDLTEDADVADGVPEEAVVCGVASEWAEKCGDEKSAIRYAEKMKDSLRAVRAARKNLALPLGRAFV